MHADPELVPPTHVAADRLLDLMSEWQARRAAGHEPAPEELCPDDPGLWAPLREQIAAARMLDPLGSAPSTGGPDSPTTADLPASIPGYQLLGEIARGGMGVVLAARHAGLDREVAVKVCLAVRNASAAAARFVAEARITGRLQHPGIPPVHDLGTLPDGRPFLAMKLVRGQTLAALLAARTATPSDLVRTFEQVCDAVGYAHAEGVIHRDLKPANVMVGAFGEVQVMDWGLAKSETSGPKPDVSEHQDARLAATQRGAFETLAGQVLGTPSYMAPEQARGEAADARADVFALGGILCAVLTGHPPHVGRTPAEVIGRAAAGDLSATFARLDGCGADAELVALCRRCLAPSSSDRPAHGEAVAEAVRAYRAGVERRLREAETERAAAEARAGEQRRKRRWQLAAVAAGAVVLLGGGAFAWWQDRQETERRVERENQDRVEQERLEHNGQSIAELLARCEAALRADDRAAATATLRAVHGRMAEGGGDAHEPRVRECDRALRLLDAFDGVDRDRWASSNGRLRTYADDAAAVAAALREYEVALGPAALPGAARRVRESVVRERILGVLEFTLFTAPSADVLALLSAVDPDPDRDALRAAVVRRDAAAIKDLAARLDPVAQPPRFVIALSTLESLPFERRKAILVAAHLARPRDVDVLQALGDLYPVNQPETAVERARWYQAVVTARPSAIAWNRLGGALRDLGDLDGAIAAFREAVALDPGHVQSRFNLANALRDRGDRGAADVEYDAIIRFKPKTAREFYNLGIALRNRGDIEGAIKAYRDAVRLDPNYADAHYNLGILLYERDDLAGALECFETAVRLSPLDAACRNRLGTTLYSLGDLDGAADSYRQASVLDRRNVKAFQFLGETLLEKGDAAGAIAVYREGIKFNPAATRLHLNLGLALEHAGDLKAAAAAYAEAGRLDPKDPAARRHLAEVNELIPLLPRLDDVAAGRAEPASPAEAFAFARLCGRPFRRQFAAAARLCGRAFAAQPQLVADPSAGNRYNAACCAALAGGGEGADAPADPAARAALRGQALDWLRADLAARTRGLDAADEAGRKRVAEKMRWWLRDPELAGVRGTFRLAALPAAEGRAWRAFWDDVRRARDRAAVTPSAGTSPEARSP
jgi:tetratricopeptide (TPR) repeat protein